jgi:tRNA-dihydrouridine synthase B
LLIEKLFQKDRPLLVLAPLAGYTDLPFRAVVKRFGADLTVSEMISSNALAYGSEKSMKMVEKSPNENPYSVQIAGSNRDIVSKAVDVLNGIDGIDIIDLNSGCPVPKVVKSGNGSALLKDLNKLTETTKVIKERSQKELTSVKVRIGFSEKYGVDIAKAVEDGGADFITVHGRTRSGGFKSEVDYDEIAKMKEAISIPLIANGDIDSFEKAQWVLQHTKSDGVMIGRGAVGKPWLFHQVRSGSSEVSRELKKEIVLEHFLKMIEFYGDRGAILFRKHLHTYSKGIEGASSFRDEVNREEDPQNVQKLILNFF